MIRFMEDFRESTTTLSLAELTSRVIRETGYAARLQEERSDEAGDRLANLQERLLAMHGECRVESQPGRGTTVKFIVPLGPAVGPPG